MPNPSIFDLSNPKENLIHLIVQRPKTIRILICPWKAEKFKFSEEPPNKIGGFLFFNGLTTS